MAKRKTAAGGGTYLYAVVAGSGENEFGSKGLYDSTVYTVHDGDPSAVVSDLPDTDKLRPERRHLAAHQGILHEVVEKNNVVLPVSFGTIADSPEGVRKLLSQHRKDLMREIKRG